MNCKRGTKFKYPYANLGDFTYKFTTRIKNNKHYFKCCVEGCSAQAFTSIKKAEQGVFYEDPENKNHNCSENHMVILCGLFKDELFQLATSSDDLESLHAKIFGDYTSRIASENVKEQFKMIIESAFSFDAIEVGLHARQKLGQEFFNKITDAWIKAVSYTHLTLPTNREV